MTVSTATANPDQRGKLGPPNSLSAWALPLPYGEKLGLDANDNGPPSSTEHRVGGVNGAAIRPRTMRELNGGGPGRPSSLQCCGSKTQGITGNQPGAERMVAKVVLEQTKCGPLQFGNAHPLPSGAVPQPVEQCLVRELAMRAQLPSGHPPGRHALGDCAASH